MLIKRGERAAHRTLLSQARGRNKSCGSIAAVFLRRSGLAAGGLAALGSLSFSTVQKGQSRPAAGARDGG